MSATVTASPLGVLVAFGAGVVSFLSPCVLPLVPGYVSLVSGLSAAELRRPDVSGVALGRLGRDLTLFVAGFTVVFVALGAAASGLGHLLGTHRGELDIAAGGVVIAFGAAVLLASAPTALWSGLPPALRSLGASLLAERRFPVGPRSLPIYAAPVVGAAFGFAWTPCIGPVLGAVSALAATKASLGGGVLLLFAYAMGLGVPFLATGLAFGRLTALYARARRVGQVVQLVGAAVLLAFGILLVTGHMGQLAAEMGQLMRHIGLDRLATS